MARSFRLAGLLRLRQRMDDQSTTGSAWQQLAHLASLLGGA
jgi:hypothetical protein